MIDEDDIAASSDEHLMRLLKFALKHDVAGPRLSQRPPTDRQGIIEQLYWIGVIKHRPGGGWL